MMMIAKSALDNYYILNGIDAIQPLTSNEEFSKHVDAVIDNQQIKEFLLRSANFLCQVTRILVL
jgi:hypothetical protein